MAVRSALGGAPRDALGPHVPTPLAASQPAGQDVFYAAVQMTRMPMCLVDPRQPDMPLVFVNSAFCNLTGYTASEVIGRNCRLLQGPDTDPDATAQIRQALIAQEPLTVELFNYRKDGTGFWNALYLSPVFDEAGEMAYLFGSQLDVTRRREAEMVLHRSRHLETLGSLADGVVHEFNNLLTVVLANLEPMERTADERNLRRLTRATDAVHRAARLTRQMLSFARQPLDGVQAADLRDTVADTDSLIGQLVGRGIQVDTVLPADPMPVLLDMGAVKTVLLNLARSARAALPDGGQLRIELSSPAADQVAMVVTAAGTVVLPAVGGEAWVDLPALAAAQSMVRQVGGSMRVGRDAAGAVAATILMPTQPATWRPAEA